MKNSHESALREAERIAEDIVDFWDVSTFRVELKASIAKALESFAEKARKEGAESMRRAAVKVAHDHYQVDGCPDRNCADVILNEIRSLPLPEGKEG